MKKLILLFSLLSLLLAGCDEHKTINGKVVPVYGFFNEAVSKDPNVVYQVSPWSVICAIVFCETLVVPIYVVGWDLFEPVKAKVVTAAPVDPNAFAKPDFK